MIIPTGFYVYHLRDPRDEVTFYVGKGCGHRAWQHEAAIRRGDRSGNARKVAKISEIINAGRRVAVYIVAEFDDEIDAYEREIEDIRADRMLTNIALGGGGIRIADPVKIAQWREAKRLRLLAKERAEAIALLARQQSAAQRHALAGLGKGVVRADKLNPSRFLGARGVRLHSLTDAEREVAGLTLRRSLEERAIEAERGGKPLCARARRALMNQRRRESSSFPT